MTAPVRVIGDPVTPIADALEAFLAPLDPLPRVATHKWPKDWSLADGRPLILVADDGGPFEWPIFSEHTIRITAGGDDVPEVCELARKCLGRILDNLPEGLAHIRENGTALDVTQHSATGADVASGTVTAVIRTTII